MFWTLPYTDSSQARGGSLEYRAQSLKWANFDWISIRPQPPAADGVEEVAKSDFIALLNSQPGELLFEGITTQVCECM